MPTHHHCVEILSKKRFQKTEIRQKRRNFENIIDFKIWKSRWQFENSSLKFSWNGFLPLAMRPQTIKRTETAKALILLRWIICKIYLNNMIKINTSRVNTMAANQKRTYIASTRFYITPKPVRIRLRLRVRVKLNFFLT